jgi:copper homeostasis protein
MKKLEIACFSLQDALRAAELGADRLEFCEDYNSGGVTPNLDDFMVLRERFSDMPIHVMIRPRSGNFIHSEAEIELMTQQITTFHQLGASGFVFGVLNEKGAINTAASQKLIFAAQGKPCVFHRAFDELHDPIAALDTLMHLGFSGVLTSGGAATAMDGLSVLKQMQSHVEQQVQIVVGGGVRSSNIEKLLSSEAQWFHSAAWNKEKQILDEQEMLNMLNLIRNSNG